MTTFKGRWWTTYGPMRLDQTGDRVTGTYGQRGATCRIEGRVTGRTLDFAYQEPEEAGRGTFTLARHGRFAGTYAIDGEGPRMPWEGARGFDGLWMSSFGALRLVEEEGGRVRGYYNSGGPAVIDGLVEGDRLSFRYEEPKAKGHGWFALDETGARFSGEWRPDSEAGWEAWVGERMVPREGLTWLVVLEAHWQRSLRDDEFAFGNMLREVFARVPNVDVRHRYFQNEASLIHWCRELIFIPEPVVLVITSHGEAEGLAVGGEIVDTRKVISTLGPAESIELLHFSCCLIAKDATGALARPPFPVSGYTTSIDWGQSAMLEFIYLDMILGKGLSPAQAAAALPRLVTIAGESVPEGSPYRAAGFRYFAPEDDASPGGAPTAVA